MSLSGKKFYYLSCGAISILQIISFVASSSLEGHYIGSQSNGNEHILLFKLPNAISSQLQEQIQQQQQLRNGAPEARPNFVQQQSLVPAQYQLNQQPTYRVVRQQQVPNYENQEQMISLTIPLPTLNKQADQQVYKAIQHYPIQQNINKLAQRPDYDQVQYETEPQYKAAEKSLYRSQVSELTSILEQQIRQYALHHQQQYQTGAENQYFTTQSPNFAPYTSANEPPQLWRDTQPSNQINNQHNSSSLLSKLGSSSPELLLKLKNLLHQATQQIASRNYTLNEYPRTLDSSKQAEHYDNAVSPTTYDNFQSNQNKYSQEYSDKPNSGADYDNNNSNSNIVSSGQNLTSHEEIKIPLVVIAMPRILSLKKNQQASVGANNVSLPQVISSTIANITNNNATNVAAHLIQLFKSNHSNPLSGFTNATNSSYPGMFSTNNNPNQYNSLNSEHVDTTTSVPQYTMAPYAHQFNIPLATPVGARHYNYQPAFLYHGHQGQVKAQPQVEQGNNMADYNAPTILNLTGNGQQLYHLQPQVLHQRKPMIELYSRVNQSSNPQQESIQLLQRPREGAGKIHLQLLENVPHEYQTVRQQFEQTLHYPKPHETAQSELNSQVLQVNNHLFNPMRKIVTLNGHNQIQYSNAPSSNSVFVPYPVIQQVYASKPAMQAPDQMENRRVMLGALPNAYARLNQAGSNINQASSSLMESGLSKLRPLFQRRHELSQAEKASNKLTSGQMLRLFGAVAERRDISSNENKQIDQQNEASAFSNNVEASGKKSPKMVLMIV